MEQRLAVGLVVAFGYGAVAVAANFVNKYAVHELPLPCTILLIQTVTTLVALRCLAALHLVRLPPLAAVRARQLLPLSGAYCLHALLVLYSLANLSIPMYNALKRLTPVMVLATKAVMENKLPDPPTALSVCLIVAGCFVAGMGDLQFDGQGYLLCLLCAFMQALYMLLAEGASAHGGSRTPKHHHLLHHHSADGAEGKDRTSLDAGAASSAAGGHVPYHHHHHHTVHVGEEAVVAHSSAVVLHPAASPALSSTRSGQPMSPLAAAAMAASGLATRASGGGAANGSSGITGGGGAASAALPGDPLHLLGSAPGSGSAAAALGLGPGPLGKLGGYNNGHGHVGAGAGSSSGSAGGDKGPPMTAVELLYGLSLLGVPMLAVLCVISGEGALAPGLLSEVHLRMGGPVFTSWFITTAVTEGLLTAFVILCTMINSALTTSIVGVLKGVVSSLLGFFFLGGVKFHALNVAGIVVNMLGGVWYSAVQYWRSKIR